MKKYTELRPGMLSGDVLMVEGQGFISKAIRALTGQQISHVAMLVWIEGGLWVAEMKEFKGFRLLPLNAWMSDNASNVVYYGVAPPSVRNKREIIESALMYRNTDYGYFSLFKVWWAQIKHKHIKVKLLVCSTYIQRCWSSAGYTFNQTADPGDYMRLCTTITPVN